MLPALGETGAAHLKERLGKVLADRSGKPGGRNFPALVVRSTLRALADGQSDVDAYIALMPPNERRMPHQGAQIGRRLLSAGRAAEALAALERIRPKRSPAKAARDNDVHLIGPAVDDAWEAAYIEALEKQGRTRPSGCAGRRSRSGP